MKAKLAVFSALCTVISMLPAYSCAPGPEFSRDDYPRYLQVEYGSVDVFEGVVEDLLPPRPENYNDYNYGPQYTFEGEGTEDQLKAEVSRVYKHAPFDKTDSILAAFNSDLGDVNRQLQWVAQRDIPAVDAFTVAATSALSDAKFKSLIQRLWVLRIEVYTQNACRNDADLFNKLGSLELPPAGVPFRDYLINALVFKCGKIDLPANLAYQRFGDLAHATNPWIAETAAYMSGRVSLAEAQKKWDNWGQPKNIDQSLLDKAEDDFKGYIRKYPNGLYARSATGLERHILRLRGDQGALNQALIAMLRDVEKSILAGTITYDEGHKRLDEFGHYFHGASDITKAPAIAVAYTILATKSKQLDPTSAKQLDSNHDLDRFPALKKLLIAVLQYKTGQYAVLAKTSTKGFDVTTPYGFGVQRLIALSRLRTDDFEGSSKVIHLLLQQDRGRLYDDKTRGDYSLRMALAVTYEKQGKLLDALSDPVVMGETMTLDDVDMDLVALLTSKQMLVLARKQHAAASKMPVGQTPSIFDFVKRNLYMDYIIEGRYKEFNDVYPELGDLSNGKLFYQVTTAMKMLAADPHNPKGALNTGYFLDSQGGGVPTNPDASKAMVEWFSKELKAKKADIAKYPNQDAYDFYKMTVDHYAHSSVKSEDEAKALHYLILCYKPHEYGSSCFSDDSYEPGDSAAWFTRLHTKYAGSSWAYKTPYHY